MKLHRITQEQFMNLKKGDIVHIKNGEIFYKSVVCRPAFYNADATDPDFEIETNNGFSDMYSIYVLPDRKKQGHPFTNEPEKMLDFLYLSKEEFLLSYSYLTENDYNTTVDTILKLLYPDD